MDAETKIFMMAVQEWNEEKCWETFKGIYTFGFRNNPNPLFRVWRIARNTLNGRYKEIEEKGCTW